MKMISPLRREAKSERSGTVDRWDERSKIGMGMQMEKVRVSTTRNENTRRDREPEQQ